MSNEAVYSKIGSLDGKDLGELDSVYGLTSHLDTNFHFDSDNSSQFSSFPELCPISQASEVTDSRLSNASHAFETYNNSLLQPVNIDLSSTKTFKEKEVVTRSIFSLEVQDIENYSKDFRFGLSSEASSESNQNSAPSRFLNSNQSSTSGKIGTGSALHTSGSSFVGNTTAENPTRMVSSGKSHHSAKFKSSTLSIESSKTISTKNYCASLVHSIEKLTPRNYAVFLVDIMRKISNQISLEDFYSLLAGSSSNKITFVNDIHQSDIFLVSGASDAIKICSFVIQTFKQANRENSLNHQDSAKPLPLASLNFNEFSRTFLAIKILFDSIKEVDKKCSTKKGIPRSSVYSVYCEISQKLSGRYKMASDSSKILKNTAIGMSQFGILTKLVYPNLEMRRLGSRGKSRPYYFGVTWNHGVVGTEMVSRVESKAPKRISRSITDGGTELRDVPNKPKIRSGSDTQENQ